jgi:hypothetical protein
MTRFLGYVACVGFAILVIVGGMIRSATSLTYENEEVELVMAQEDNPQAAAKWELFHANKLRKTDALAADLQEITALILEDQAEEASEKLSALTQNYDLQSYSQKARAVHIAVTFLEKGHEDKARDWFRFLRQDPQAVYARTMEARHLLALRNEEDKKMALTLVQEAYKDASNYVSPADYLLHAEVLVWNDQHEEAEILATAGARRFDGQSRNGTHENLVVLQRVLSKVHVE